MPPTLITQFPQSYVLAYAFEEFMNFVKISILVDAVLHFFQGKPNNI